MRPPPRSTLFPYTTLFRSRLYRHGRAGILPDATSKAGQTAAKSGKVGQKAPDRSEEHTSELQSRSDLVCRLLLEKKKFGYCNLVPRVVSGIDLFMLGWLHAS